MNGKDTMKIKVNFTIFGGTGDLTFRKLLPALYNMSISKELDEQSRIVIIGRRDYDNSSYREKAATWVKQFARLPYREDDFQAFASKIEYFQMDFTNEDAYHDLNTFYAKDEIASHIFYFAVAPRFFDNIAKGLAHVDHAEKGKVIIEKPFGEDLTSAKKLNDELEAFFGAEQIYHIDHYLGKEMVRNIQTIRFMNPIFTNIWNSEFIDNIQISAMENVGVETRGGYYDQSGALKDMVQNHLFQILSIIAMEQPDNLYGSDFHDKQLEVLHSLRPVEKVDIADTMVLGQYFGYQKEPSVSLDSITETYAALRLFIDNERWHNTPFYIRTGKKLNHRQMEVVVVFRRSNPDVSPNVLVIKIQPSEGIKLQFNIKRPGDSDEIIETSMDFCQSCSDIFRINTPEAYERLLTACLNSESAWFSKWDKIELSWNYIEELKQRYYAEKQRIVSYPSGTSGPSEANELLTRHEHAWLDDFSPLE